MPLPAHPPPIPIPLVTLPPHPCPYLPNRQATNRAFLAKNLSPDLYHQFMDAGFRRSGSLIYQPICQDCRACLPIRVPVDQFHPSKSQRRCWRRNADLLVTESKPTSSDEKFALYERYMKLWHSRPASDDQNSRRSFDEFLYESPVDTREFTYRLNDQLVAVGICDLSKQSLSSVYFYFDPAHSARGLGTFGALHELAWAKSAGIPFYYLGFWVHGCGAMEYKSSFNPHQILSPTGAWCGHCDHPGV